MNWARNYLTHHTGKIIPRVKDKRAAYLTTVVMDTARAFSQRTTQAEDKYSVVFMDNGSDTCGIGGNAWIIDHVTERKVQVIGYHKTDTKKNSIEIGAGITAIDLPDGETILIRVCEATLLGENANSLFSVNQIRSHGVFVDDVPKQFGGMSCMEIEDAIIPLFLHEGMICLNIRKPNEEELDNCVMFDLTSILPWNPNELTDENQTMDIAEYAELRDKMRKRKLNIKTHAEVPQEPEEVEPFFLYPGKDIMMKTLENTTQFGHIEHNFPMRVHHKSRNPILQRRRLNEDYATDSWFSTVTSYEGYNGAQAFFGIMSKFMSHYGFKTESEGPDCLLDFFRKEGVPISILSDNSKMQTGKAWEDYLRRFWVNDKQIEPGRPSQNPFEREFSIHKAMIDKLMITSGCDPRAWFKAACHVADVRNCTAIKSLNHCTPFEMREHHSPDISALLQFKFWEMVYYKKKSNDFPEGGGSEGLGHWLGRAPHIGDGMAHHILTTETEQIVVRSMVRTATDTLPNEGHKESMDKEIEKTKARQAKGEPETSQFFTNNEGNDHLVGKHQDLPGHPDIKRPGNPQIIENDRMIDLYVYDSYTNRKGNETKMRGQVRKELEGNKFQVTFENGKNRTYEYEELINKINKPDEEGVELWQFDDILDHRWTEDPNRKGKIDVLLKWSGYEEPTWEPMEMIKKDDPVSLAAYAKKKKLLNQSCWKWAQTYLKQDTRFARMMRQVQLNKAKTNTIKYNFGVRVPRTIKEALALDKMNGNTKWSDAIETELRALHEEHKCFKTVKSRNDVPKGYKYIPLLWAFAVKFDLRHRARCVAGGHVTPDLEFDLYSGVVDLETVRIAFVASTLTQLQIIAADIGSAYIQALTGEKVFTVAGPEWAILGMEGQVLIVHKALYGLKSSGAMWHRKLAANLRDLGFVPCEADHDFWMKDKGDHYEYIAIIVDDVLLFSRDPDPILEYLKNECGYILKGVGTPDYYNGADFGFTKNAFPWMSCKTYIANICDKIEKLMEVKLKGYGSPMEVGDHPESDESDFLPASEIPIYQMLIGCAQWAVTLGRFDVQYATNTLARFAAIPREGHKRRALRLFGYLKHHPRACTIFSPIELDMDHIKFEEHDWTDLYPFAQEHISGKVPKTHNKEALSFTVIGDASHASCYETRRSHTGLMAILGSTVIKTYSKRQNTVETSTYGSEVVAMRLGVEMALEIRYKLRMMGIKFQDTSVLLCDNESVVINTQFPSSNLKKKHNAVSYHKVREAVAAKIVKVGHIPGVINLADILTKPLGPQAHYELLKPVLFRSK